VLFRIDLNKLPKEDGEENKNDEVDNIACLIQLKKLSGKNAESYIFYQSEMMVSQYLGKPDLNEVFHPHIF
jgi:hypothetical protein